MSERVDLGPMARAADERVVRRHRPVVLEAQHLAAQAVGILRAVSTTAAGRHIQRAVTAEGHARAAADASWSDEDVADIGQCRAVPVAARDGGGRLLSR